MFAVQWQKVRWLLVLIFVDDGTINGQNSHSMLKVFFVLKLKRLDKASSANVGENGAPVHFSLDVRHYFDKVFPNRWI